MASPGKGLLQISRKAEWPDRTVVLSPNGRTRFQTRWTCCEDRHKHVVYAMLKFVQQNFSVIGA
jgi:hypothetical protein